MSKTIPNLSIGEDEQARILRGLNNDHHTGIADWQVRSVGGGMAAFFAPARLDSGDLVEVGLAIVDEWALGVFTVDGSHVIEHADSTGADDLLDVAGALLDAAGIKLPVLVVRTRPEIEFDLEQFCALLMERADIVPSDRWLDRELGTVATFAFDNVGQLALFLATAEAGRRGRDWHRMFQIMALTGDFTGQPYRNDGAAMVAKIEALGVGGDLAWLKQEALS